MDIDELSSIIHELQSIIDEMRDVESELRTKFKGIGTERFIANKLSEKTDKLVTAKEKLKQVDKSLVDE